MNKILSLILLSLYICSAFSAAETLAITREGTNKEPQSVLIYKCAGSATLAAGDTVTHTFTYIKVSGGSYADVSGLTGSQVVEGPRTVGQAAYSYLLIKQGSFAVDDAVQIKCTSTWTGTTTNSQATAVESTAVTIAGTTGANTKAMTPTLNSEKTSLGIAIADQTVGTDKIQYILPNTAISTASTTFTIDVSNAIDGKIHIIYNVGGGADGAQQLLSYDLAKISATVSAKKNNCEVMTPVFKVPKVTNFSTATVTLELNDGTTAVVDKAVYYQTTESTDVVVKVYIQSESLKGKSTAYLTIKIVQNSAASAVLSTSYVKYAIPAVGSEAYCTMSTATATLTSTSLCAKQTITTSVSGKIESVQGNTAIALATDGKTIEFSPILTEKHIILQTINSTDSTKIESKYFVLDPTALKPCLVVTKTAGTKACEEAKFTCERKTGPTTGAISYDWSYAPAVNGFTLAADVEASSVSTQTIAASKLAAGTQYTITCKSSLATVSESNDTSVEYTPTADACTSSPADDDDDDNSSILGVLVIALLALVF